MLSFPETAAAEGHPIKFMQFLKYGIVAMLISLLLSTVYVWFRFLN